MPREAHKRSPAVSAEAWSSSSSQRRAGSSVIFCGWVMWRRPSRRCIDQAPVAAAMAPGRSLLNHRRVENATGWRWLRTTG
jgi:hypothetical protein